MHKSEQTLIFLHIPKAAGTTLHRIIERQYEKNAIYTINGSRVQESIAEFKKLPEEQKREIRILKGHMDFGLHKYFTQPSTYITMLRNPVDRIISHYYYVLRSPYHYLYDKLTTRHMSLKDYVSSGISTELDNGQTRLLSGGSGVGFRQCSTMMLELAKKNLKEQFTVVGLSERFIETLILLKRTFRWKTPLYTKQNVNRNRAHKENISKDTLNIIEKYNELDIELYRFVTMMFEELISQQGPSFEKELKYFKLLNKCYNNVLSFSRPVIHKIKESCRRSVGKNYRLL